MFMLNLLNWWYARGWKDFLHSAGQHLYSLADFFSIDLLFKTLFAPFRQISAGTSKNVSFDVRLRMFFDRLVSRFIGAIVRIFIILAGLLTIIFVAFFVLLVVIIWPILPFAPVLGLILTVSGVTI